MKHLNAALEGRYRIEREIGEGGMATVYLAEDLKHHRKVALKVLKPELAAVVGAERFLAEIETTANLQHPHILPLYDSGRIEADGPAPEIVYFVMPYVEGESLRDRLDREKQLPVDEGVDIARKVAGALDYAHDRGIIHRDIKPANILLHGGEPVVADFGIALAVGAAGGGRLTETGLSLGTPYYMSPEQATGDQPVGPATDIYALGCVLYEMLVGEPPYPGSTAQAVLGRILQGEPVSATAARRSVPPNVDAAIRKALEKLPADRFSSSGAFTAALSDEWFRYGQGESPVNAGLRRWKVTAGVTAMVSMVTIAALVWVLNRREPAGLASNSIVRFTMPLARDTALYLGGERDALWGRPASPSMAISPDGSRLVYAGWRLGTNREQESRLYLRRFDRERAEVMTGTEGAMNPFFSPDGEWVGFFEASVRGPRPLRRISMSSGNVETIVPDIGSFPRGGTWDADGTIVYAISQGLYRVAGTGGRSIPLVERDTISSGSYRYAQPHLLPGGEVVLFHAMGSQDPTGAEIRALDLSTGDETTVLRDAMDPRFVETGHLLFMRRGTLMAIPFDPVGVEVEGQPVIVIEDVMQSVGMPNPGWETGAGQLTVSRTGHLVYARGGVFPEIRTGTVLRLSPEGESERIGLEPRQYGTVRASPDGNRLATEARDGLGLSIWVHDLRREVTQRINTGAFENVFPVWSPDGESIVFTSDREDGVRNIYRMAVDGEPEPERLAPSGDGQYPLDWSPEGDIVYEEDDDLWVLSPDGESTPFLTTDAAEGWAALSPNGRWIAYASDQSGRFEIYVRPYPGSGPATLVSGRGGTSPSWSPNGRRLYYLEPRENLGRRLMVVNISPGYPFRASRAERLIDPWPYGTFTPGRGYDVLPDGSFIGVALEDPEPGTDERPELSLRLEARPRVDEIHLVLNFFDELRERAGSGTSR